jgi:hypothetical protein
MMGAAACSEPIGCTCGGTAARARCSRCALAVAWPSLYTQHPLSTYNFRHTILTPSHMWQSASDAGRLSTKFKQNLQPPNSCSYSTLTHLLIGSLELDDLAPCCTQTHAPINHASMGPNEPLAGRWILTPPPTRVTPCPYPQLCGLHRSARRRYTACQATEPVGRASQHIGDSRLARTCPHCSRSAHRSQQPISHAPTCAADRLTARSSQSANAPICTADRLTARSQSANAPTCAADQLTALEKQPKTLSAHTSILGPPQTRGI